MNLSDLKKQLQNHFKDGLVTIVGSGLSVAEGIPGMPALANHILTAVAPVVPSTSASQWDKIATSLSSGIDLETTLLTHQPDTDLETLIVEETGSLIAAAEQRVFQEVIGGARTLRLSRLLRHMLKPEGGIPIITTNYDRLIELAAEAAGLGVDNLFVGRHLGRLDPKESRFCLCRGLVETKVGKMRKAYPKLCQHVRVMKPHGSLDWFRGTNGPICCYTPLTQKRLLITPGLNKYRGGYDPPFDTHRDKANTEIDRASRFLFIGYGFNDEHLQTHLEPRLRNGIPAVIITRSLSAKAKCLVSSCPGMMALTEREDGAGSLVITSGNEHFVPGSRIWDVESFVSEVLQP